MTTLEGSLFDMLLHMGYKEFVQSIAELARAPDIYYDHTVLILIMLDRKRIPPVSCSPAMYYHLVGAAKNIRDIFQ